MRRRTVRQANFVRSGSALHPNLHNQIANCYDLGIPHVRRLNASTLLFFVLLPLLSPLTALANDEDPNLPACCRRHGGMRHQCAMMMAYLMARLPGTKLLPTPVPCPDAPVTTAPTTQPFLHLDQASHFFAEVVAHPALHVQTEARARVALDRAWRKRGPPSVVLS